MFLYPPWFCYQIQVQILGTLVLRKVYCRAKEGDRVDRVQGNPDSPMVFWEEFFIGKLWAEDCRVDGFLLMG